MKVMHVLNTGKYSGAENVACQIIHMVEKDNIESVYTSFDGTIRDALDERGVTFAPVNKLSLKEIKRIIQQEHPDLIHAHDMKAGLVCALACGNVPLISHIHNNSFDSRKLTLKAVLFYYAARKAQHIFWVSRSSYEGYYFHKRVKNKSSILQNIIDIDQIKEKRAQDTNEYPYNIVFLGRMTPQKNPYRLLRVLHKAIELDPDLKVAVVGTGEMDREIRKASFDMGLDNNVDFLGFMANPYKLLYDAKVMIMTSLWEGTPMAALEAMSLGVPIVTTPTDGLIDVVENGITGFLTDDDDELAKFIVRISKEDELHEKMSQAAIKRATALMDAEIYHKQIMEEYKRCFGVVGNE